MRKATYSILALCVMVSLLVVGTSCAPSKRLMPAAATPIPAPAEVPRMVEVEGADYGLPAAELKAIERMVIKGADISLLVTSTEDAISEVTKIAKDLDGYVVSSNTWLEDERKVTTVTIRVPADSFDAAMGRLREIALEVTAENISGGDVTEEYTDLESRLRNLEAAEAQLLKIMEQAKKTEDVLAVYRELVNTRGEIERIKGRMNYLKRSAAMAAITVSIHPKEMKPIIKKGWDPVETLRSASRALVTAAQFVVDAAIWFAAFVLPILLLFAIPLAIVWLAWRRWRRGKKNEPMTNVQ